MTNKIVDVRRLLGLKIKIERIKLGISQEELADRASVNKNTIGAIERGEQSSTIDTLVMITDVFKLNLKDLFNFDSL